MIDGGGGRGREHRAVVGDERRSGGGGPNRQRVAEFRSDQRTLAATLTQIR